MSQARASALASAGSRPSARNSAPTLKCRIVDPRNLGGRIEPPQPRDQRRLGLFRMRLFQQIALGDEDMIGQRDLAHGLDVIVERPRAVYGIDRRDDGADAIQPGERRVRQETPGSAATDRRARTFR